MLLVLLLRAWCADMNAEMWEHAPSSALEDLLPWPGNYYIAGLGLVLSVAGLAVAVWQRSLAIAITSALAGVLWPLALVASMIATF